MSLLFFHSGAFRYNGSRLIIDIMRTDYGEDDKCRDPLAFHELSSFLEKTFTAHRRELHAVIGLASKICAGIEKLDPFLQQANRNVCRECRNVCCISKHGYYNNEDLIYLSALGLKPPHVIFGRHDKEPCQYLLESGCSIERWRRPSGCNWYFCDSLLDYIEPQSWYWDFDDSLRQVAELWLAMVKEFRRVIDEDWGHIHSGMCPQYD